MKFKKNILIILMFFILSSITFSAPGDIKWKFDCESISSSAAIGENGEIYFTTNQFLYALNPDGSKKWRIWLDSLPIHSSPTIDTNGTIYICFQSYNEGYLYAINPEGTIKWKFYFGWEISSEFSPAVGSDGTIYVGSTDNILYAINPDGSLKWTFDTNNEIKSVPAVGVNNTVYIGSSSKLYSINSDGSLNWVYDTNSTIESDITIGNQETIFLGCDDNNLYAINPDGSLKWKFSTNGYLNSSPVISQNGIVYIGSKDDNLYAINPDGSLKWKFKAEGSFNRVSPLIDNAGTLFIGNSDGFLYAINPDGTLKWKTNIGSVVYASPTLGSNGTIYIGSYDFYAIESESDSYANSPWPVFGKNNKNTSKVKESDFKIIISTPNQNEILKQGNVYKIKWFDQISSNVKIELYKDNTYYCTITDSVSSTGEYNWFVDNSIETGSDYKIKIISIDNTNIFDISNYSFTISEEESIKIKKPNGSENWSKNKSYEIKWDDNIDENIKIDLYKNNFYHSTIVESTESDGSYYWKIPSTIEPGTKYKIKITSLNEQTVSDISDLFFEIDQSLEWKYTIPSEIDDSSPAVGSNGTIYIGGDDGYLYAISPDGTLKWKYLMEENIFNCSPSIDDAGVIYMISKSGYLYAINSDGTLKWKYNIESSTRFYETESHSPAIGGNGIIYFGYGSYLYAINPDGSKKWRFDTGNNIYSSPSIAKDGTIYIGSNKLYAVNPEGTLKWSFNINHQYSRCAPIIDNNGTIYIGIDDGYLYAINPDGTLKWKFTNNNIRIPSSISIGKNGILYFCVSSGVSNPPNIYKIYAINPDGTLRWEYDCDSPLLCSPAIGSDGTIYITSFYKLLAISTDGTKKWDYNNGYKIKYSSPVIDKNGMIYFGSKGGEIYAIQSISNNLLDSPWSMYNKDMKHTSSFEITSQDIIANLIPSDIINGYIKVYIKSLIDISNDNLSIVITNNSTTYEVNSINTEKGIFESSFDFNNYKFDDNAEYTLNVKYKDKVVAELTFQSQDLYDTKSFTYKNLEFTVKKTNSERALLIDPKSETIKENSLPAISKMFKLEVKNKVKLQVDNPYGEHGGLMKYDNGQWKLIDSTNNKFEIYGSGTYAIVKDKKNSIIPKIKKNKLAQNYPNPFNPTTTIKYTVKTGCQVKLLIYGMKGRKIKTLVNEYKEKGSYRVDWDGKDKNGKIVSSGVYYYVLKSNDKKLIKKMVLLK